MLGPLGAIPYSGCSCPSWMAHCFGRVVGGLLQGGGAEVGGSEAGAKARGNAGTWQVRKWEVEGGDPGVLYLFLVAEVLVLTAARWELSAEGLRVMCVCVCAHICACVCRHTLMCMCMYSPMGKSMGLPFCINIGRHHSCRILWGDEGNVSSPSLPLLQPNPPTWVEG